MEISGWGRAQTLQQVQIPPLSLCDLSKLNNFLELIYLSLNTDNGSKLLTLL